MYCPRCGESTKEGDRFCAACGADLSPARKPRPARPGLGDRIGRLIGTTRRARLITAATAVAVAIAVAAFVALKPADEGVPRDAYTIAADGQCVQAKREIGAAARRTLAKGDRPDLERYATSLVPIIARWRSELHGLQVPSGRADPARAFDTALRDVEIEVAALARVEREEGGKAVIAQAGRADAATRHLGEAASSLGLDECARFGVAGATPKQ